MAAEELVCSEVSVGTTASPWQVYMAAEELVRSEVSVGTIQPHPGRYGC